jgi:mannose-6-phosphate isomerase-like protein (cupin superfamily)
LDLLIRTVRVMSTPTHSLLVRAATAEVLSADPTSVITLLADAGQTGGRFTSNRTLFTAGAAGAPPHFHTLGTEIFFVLDGTFQVLLDDVIVELGPGDMLAVPPNVHHAFGPAPDRFADVLVMCVPGRERFDYYRLLDRVHQAEAGWDEVHDSQDRFDNHYVESATWQAR